MVTIRKVIWYDEHDEGWRWRVEVDGHRHRHGFASRPEFAERTSEQVFLETRSLYALIPAHGHQPEMLGERPADPRGMVPDWEGEFLG